MNRQKAEEKGIGRSHRRKEVGIGRMQRNGQVKEIGRTRQHICNNNSPYITIFLGDLNARNTNW